jgi:hypothetical protein
MIGYKDVAEHKQKYPSFDSERFIEWMNEKPGRWFFMKSVAKANHYCRIDLKWRRDLEAIKANHMEHWFCD